LKKCSSEGLGGVDPSKWDESKAINGLYLEGWRGNKGEGGKREG
jgi:hypothetical protein